MKDSEFDALKLTMAIVPEQSGWTEPRFDHETALHCAADTARGFVGKAYGAMDKAEGDGNLTSVGKKNAKTKIAEAVLAELEKSDALQRARAAVQRQNEIWDSKFGLTDVIQQASNVHEAAVYTAIWNRVAAMDAAGRMKFFSQHADDKMVLSACLTAPGFVTGLSDSELGVIRSKLERSMIPPEVLQARTNTSKMLVAVERGFARAVTMISERAGLKAEPVPNLTEQAKAKSEAAA